MHIMGLLSFINGAWIPIHSIRSLEYTQGKPTKIKIFNRDWVAWRDNILDVWCLNEDICPHRFAPLSQGKINYKTGCLECPYHGWQFDMNGKCTKIPHERFVNNKIKVRNIITHTTGDLLWGFFPTSISSLNESIEILPEHKCEFLKEYENHTYYIRELPYSWNILVENLMDPLYFSTNIEDGSSINIKTKTFNDTHCELYFTDKIKNKKREGMLTFQKPVYFSFSTKYEKNNWIKNINTLTVPIKEGSSRIFMITPFTKSKLPVWLKHAVMNRFLNTKIWLHDAEIYNRNSNKEHLSTTSSDKAPYIFRLWWTKNGMKETILHTFSASRPHKLKKIPHPQQMNIWNTHTKHCKDCRNALKTFKRVKMLPLLFYTLYQLENRKILIYLTVFSGILTILSEQVINIIKGTADFYLTF